MKFKLNKINYKSILSGILGKRNLFLMVFFGALLIFNFNAIYQEAYVKLMYLDSSEALKSFDGKRETIIIKKLTENLKLREDRIQKELLNDHKNIFIYEPVPESSQQQETIEKIDSLESSDAIEKVTEVENNESVNVPESVSSGILPELSN